MASGTCRLHSMSRLPEESIFFVYAIRGRVSVMGFAIQCSLGALLSITTRLPVELSTRSRDSTVGGLGARSGDSKWSR